ncbi:MAG: hypothetical protein KDI01_09995 [Halioglobus sp.]|nr:hypothetical protein [Halioglobus sp.]
MLCVKHSKVQGARLDLQRDGSLQRKHAMEMALTGDMFSAADALRFGLINRAVPADALHALTEQLAQKIAAKSARGIRAGKEVFYRQIDMPLEQAFAVANEAMLRGLLSGDAQEGTRAFFDRRAPVWSEA